jgi:hypothetical protein
MSTNTQQKKNDNLAPPFYSLDHSEQCIQKVLNPRIPSLDVIVLKSGANGMMI